MSYERQRPGLLVLIETCFAESFSSSTDPACINVYRFTGMAEASSALLVSMRENFKHPSLVAMLTEIESIIDSETQAHKQAFISRTQHCFAVRNGADGLLDIARATFCRLTEEIHILVASYREQSEADIKVRKPISYFSAGKTSHSRLSAASLQSSCVLRFSGLTFSTSKVSVIRA